MSAKKLFFRRVFCLFSPIVVVVAASLLSSCANKPINWLANRSESPALIPPTFARCKGEKLGYEPRRLALLGQKASEVWRWAEVQLPNNFKMRKSGRLALIPNRSPGVAVQVRVERSRVAFLVIQSHAVSTDSALPLTKSAVAEFLEVATTCPTYRVCKATENLEEIRFTGLTTCSHASVPIQIVTPRSSRKAVSVAVWLPSFSPDLNLSEDHAALPKSGAFGGY